MGVRGFVAATLGLLCACVLASCGPAGGLKQLGRQRPHLGYESLSGRAV